MAQNNAKDFLESYNKLDYFMRKQLRRTTGYDSHSNLLREMAKRNHVVFQKNLQDLLLYADLRNALVHNPFLEEVDPIAEPHDRIVEQYTKIVEAVMNPPKAVDTIAVLEADIYKIEPKDRVVEVMQRMSRFAFTHAPIMRGGRIVGVFSTDTIFDYLANDISKGMITERMQIRDLIQYTKLECHANDYFRFMSVQANTTEVEEAFSHSPHPEKRTALVFLTDNEKASGTLIAMVTPWDILSFLNSP